MWVQPSPSPVMHHITGQFHSRLLTNMQRAAHALFVAAALAPAAHAALSVCSPEQAKQAFTVWQELDAPASACAPYVVAIDGQSLLQYPCSARECITELETSAAKLPPCVATETTTSSLAEDVLTRVEICMIGGDLPYSNAATTTTPPPSQMCTASQVAQAFTVFTEVTQLPECFDYSIAFESYAGLLAPCASSCTTAAARKLNSFVLNCFYKLDGVNLRQAASEAKWQCSESKPFRMGMRRNVPVAPVQDTSGSESAASGSAEEDGASVGPARTPEKNSTTPAPTNGGNSVSTAAIFATVVMVAVALV